MSILRATPFDLSRFLLAIDSEAIIVPMAPGKWSVRDVLAHMTDVEIVWATQLRQAVDTPGATAAAFDMDARSLQYRAYTAEGALKTFTALREWNLLLIASLTSERFSNRLVMPWGETSLRNLIEVFAGHDRNHLTALRRFLSTRIAKSATPAQ